MFLFAEDLKNPSEGVPRRSPFYEEGGAKKRVNKRFGDGRVLAFLENCVFGRS